MAFGGFSDGRQPAPMAEINVTPMVDVMLVLLVIFIISAPLFTQAVKLELPKTERLPKTPSTVKTVQVSIDAAGQVFWDGAPLDAAALNEKLAEVAAQAPQPELQLRADKATRYEALAQLMSAAQARGVGRLGFVTEPAPAARTGK